MSCESPFPPALRQRLAAMQAAVPARFRLGVEALDARLGGGLARARLHEVWAQGPADGISATGFALLLAARAGGGDGPILWIAEDRGDARSGALYPPGLAELGITPARMLFVRAPDEKTLLRVAGDTVRSPAAGTVVIAPGGSAPSLDLTASRRLTLFAERSGTTAILLRTADPHCPSAAVTRWRVAAAASAVLEANAPGAPAFVVDLVRQRGGAPSSGWQLEWDRDRACFAPLSRAVAADAGGGLLAAG